mgnify:CR=1 FL=1
MIPPSKIKMQEGLHNDLIKQPRKIIQIATDADAGDWWSLSALCDDGSVWMLKPADGRLTWERLPDIPQDETEKAKYRIGDKVVRDGFLWECKETVER